MTRNQTNGRNQNTKEIGNKDFAMASVLTEARNRKIVDISLNIK